MKSLTGYMVQTRSGDHNIKKNSANPEAVFMARVRACALKPLLKAVRNYMLSVMSMII